MLGLTRRRGRDAIARHKSCIQAIDRCTVRIGRSLFLCDSLADVSLAVSAVVVAAPVTWSTECVERERVFTLTLVAAGASHVEVN